MELNQKLSNLITKSISMGIDGMDGSGKSTLAKFIGMKLGVPIIDIDSYIKEKVGTYVDNLDYAELKSKLESIEGKFIITGVCLLDVIEKLDLKLDLLIYIKRYNNKGIWVNAEECSTKKSPVKTIEMLTLKYGEPSSLTKELIHYHSKKTPVRAASYIFKNSYEPALSEEELKIIFGDNV